MKRMDRREFLHTGTVLGAASLSGMGRINGLPAADLVLRGGTVFDGTGAPGMEADVRITRARPQTLYGSVVAQEERGPRDAVGEAGQQ